MDIKQFKDDQAAIWEYLPDIDTLLEYLGRNDLVELSKCSKHYRNQLEPYVLKNLSLNTWKNNNLEFYYELETSSRLQETLEILKTDLGNKLKFIKKFTLNCEINCGFAELFVELLSNINTLFIYGCSGCKCSCCYSNCFLYEGLETILKGMEGLEHVYISDIDYVDYEYNKEKQIFPKSIKSLNISHIYPEFQPDDLIRVYDTIDTRYVNLQSLTIISNRMLQNLSCGMPNLKEVDIRKSEILNASKVVAFLKANPQIKKLDTDNIQYNEEIFKTVLSYKYLGYWNINNVYLE